MNKIFLMLTMIFAAHATVSAAANVKSFISTSYAEKHATGLVRTAKSKEFLSTAPHVSYLMATTPVPRKFSLRGKAGPVENQGQCGSCWDFALTTSLRGTWMTAGHDTGRLSFNYLLNCTTTAQGCQGGDFDAADLFITPRGAPTYGSDGDYSATDGSCVQAKAVASTLSYNMLGTGDLHTGHETSFQDIAYVVGVLHQPVSVDIAADSTFEGYAGGVYDGCSDENAGDIDHMVVIEGYDCETSVDKAGNCVFNKDGNLPAGVGLWIVRNSWGGQWGDRGYITMKATDSNGQRCNAIATDALYFKVK